MLIARRPKPGRSGYDGCAPTRTACASAASTVAVMEASSPAWPPQATLAEVTRASRARSRSMPSESLASPTSAFRSMLRLTTRSAGFEPLDDDAVAVDHLLVAARRHAGSADDGTGHVERVGT